MFRCIICQSTTNAPSIEHIVPRSLGNIHYILHKGQVCKNCNNRFAKHEHTVLNSPSWIRERKKYGTVRSDHNADTQDLKEMHLARFLLKMFFEGMYHSRRKDFDRIIMESIRQEILGHPSTNYEIFENKKLAVSKPVPGWFDRWRLGMNGISLKYHESNDALWFEFSYGQLIYMIKIVNE